MAKKKQTGGKKEQFTEKKKSKTPLIFGGVVVAMVLFAGASFALNASGGNAGGSSSPGREKVAGPQTYAGNTDMTDIPATVENGKLAFNLDEVKKNKMVGFTYAGNKIDLGAGQAGDMPLVAFIDNNGNLDVSAAMCEPCKSIRFHIEADNTLTCNLCGAKWNLNDLSPVSGACSQYAPEELEYTTAGGKVSIEESVLKSWKPRI